MDIYLIRHTQTTAAKGLCYGQSDIALADSFLKEASLVQQKLTSLNPDCLIYSSPLQRCVRLAGLFTPHIIQDARLLELNFGDWENVPFDALDQQILQHWTENFIEVAPPNGENFMDLCQRVGLIWDDLIQTEAEQIAIFTHAGVIRAFLATILQLPAKNAFQFRVDIGSVHKMQHINHYTYINFLNL